MSAQDGEPGSKRPGEDMTDCQRVLLKRVKDLMVEVDNGLAGASKEGRDLLTSKSATELNGHLFI